MSVTHHRRAPGRLPWLWTERSPVLFRGAILACVLLLAAGGVAGQLGSPFTVLLICWWTLLAMYIALNILRGWRARASRTTSDTRTPLSKNYLDRPFGRKPSGGAAHERRDTDAPHSLTTLLNSTERVADESGETARQENEKIQKGAEQKAVTIAEGRRDAERIRRSIVQMRTEAEHYSQETRAAADSYAEQRRREVENEASKTLAKAEMAAREIREAADRREALAGDAERFEIRLQSLLSVFKGMTAQLEELLGREQPNTREEEEVHESAPPRAS